MQIHQAAMRGDKEAIIRQLRAGVSSVRSSEAAEILVNGGARLDLQDDFGGTAIHHHSDDEIRQFLQNCLSS